MLSPGGGAKKKRIEARECHACIQFPFSVAQSKKASTKAGI